MLVAASKEAFPREYFLAHLTRISLQCLLDVVNSFQEGLPLDREQGAA